MKLSTRSTYGMRALVELALASGHGPLSASSIATRQDLSVAYLEQLLHRLKRQGIITSVRGPRGGYALAREPQRITMGEVVNALDGVNGNGKGRGAAKGGRRGASNGRDTHTHLPALRQRSVAGQAGRRAQRIAHAVWRSIHERIAESLGTVTLQDLCDAVRSDGGEPVEHRYVFHI